MQYTVKEFELIGKTYTSLMYKKITLGEAEKILGSIMFKECEIYKNIQHDVNQTRRQIKHGAPMKETPLKLLKAIYPHLIEENKRMYIRNVIIMAHRNDIEATMQWAKARELELKPLI